jgi:hypothetical protein
MVHEELQELELSVCEGRLLALMTDHPLETCQIAPHTIKDPPLELEEIGVDTQFAEPADHKSRRRLISQCC